MIDTIRMKINTTKDSGFHDRMLGAGYSYAEQHKIDQDGVSNENRVYTNPSNGLRISGDEIHATSLEVSLPRLLKGSNGLLIRDQGELDQATSQLENEIESVMELPDEYKVTRIDSCVHVRTPCGTSDVIRMLGNQTHPRIRKRATIYHGESVNFKGSMYYLRCYDKQLEKYKKSGDITRIELQMRKGALDKVLGKEQRVMSQLKLDGQHIYSHLAEFMHDFQPGRIYPQRLDWYWLLATVEKKLPEDFHAFMDSQTKRNYYRYKKNFRKAKYHWQKWDWKEVLPTLYFPQDSPDVKAA